MKTVLFLGNDTLHRRYFINTLKTQGFQLGGILFEKSSVKPPFHTHPFFEEEERLFEKQHFFQNVSNELTGETIKIVENLNDPEALSWIAAMKPDLGIVSGARKLSPDVIGLFKDGLINVHLGVAEHYRGLDSNLWALYHNDYDHLGVTIHKVEPTLDTGDIIYQEKVSLPANAKIFQVRYYTMVAAVDFMMRALTDYLAGNIPSRPQEHLGRYYSFMPLCLKEVVAKKFDTRTSRL